MADGGKVGPCAHCDNTDILERRCRHGWLCAACARELDEHSIGMSDG